MMKHLLKFFFLFLILGSCSKPKTVLICGDHICINKSEAKQYFEENLSIEVKIIDKKLKKDVDLVELNLSTSPDGKKEVIISKKSNTKNDIKTLSVDEINIIKENIKKKKRIVKKDGKIKKTKEKNTNSRLKNVNKVKSKEVDVCTILKDCSIDEISKYLIKEGKKKNYPDLTKK